MKKIISLVLSVLVLTSVLSLTGCGAKNVKIGLGVNAYIEGVQSADGETNGKASTVATAAAVMLDDNGKVVKCAIDTAEIELGFTSEGKFVTVGYPQTKHEQGDKYGMKAHANATKEWYEQVDAFAALVKGKTLEDIKALVAADNKGNDEVINAGCTIIIADFVKALEAAINNAVDSKATSDDIMNVGIALAPSGKDATEENKGENALDATITAIAMDKNEKITACITDALTGKVEFDTKGVTETQNAEITTKLAAGDKYGMKAYGQDLNGDGVVKEWYEQVAEFNKAVIDKTPAEISAFAANDGYPIADLQTAGCTINISEILKSTLKAAVRASALK